MFEVNRLISIFYHLYLHLPHLFFGMHVVRNAFGRGIRPPPRACDVDVLMALSSGTYYREYVLRAVECMYGALGCVLVTTHTCDLLFSFIVRVRFL